MGQATSRWARPRRGPGHVAVGPGHGGQGHQRQWIGRGAEGTVMLRWPLRPPTAGSGRSAEPPCHLAAQCHRTRSRPGEVQSLRADARPCKPLCAHDAHTAQRHYVFACHWWRVHDAWICTHPLEAGRCESLCEEYNHRKRRDGRGHQRGRREPLWLIAARRASARSRPRPPAW